MALTRRSGQRFQASIWPGFVDAMTGLLLVLMFVLTIFMVVQFVLRETISGQEEELGALTREVSALAEALGLEQDKSASLATQVGGLTDALTDAREGQEAQAALIDRLTRERDAGARALAEADARITGFEARVAGLLAERDRARAQVSDLEGAQAALLSEQEALTLALVQARDETDAEAEAARLAAARAEALEALVADLESAAEAAGTRIDALEADRLADAAAAEALRQRLSDADAELTAMTLALEEQRRAAEETLTLLAAANAARDSAVTDLATALLARQQAAEDLSALDARLAAAVLAREAAETEAGSLQDELAQALARARAAEDQAGDAAAGRADLETRLAEALLARETLEARVAALSESPDAGAARADLEARLAEALAARSAAEAASASAEDEAARRAALLETARAELSAEERLSQRAQRQVAVLNEQVAELRRQIGSLQALLDLAEEADREAQVEIASLGEKLNTALARVAIEQRARAELEEAERQRLQEERDRLAAEAEDLERYRSDFFGEMRAILAGQEGVRIVGDRFVFSSEVLFEPGSADLSEDGRAQIASIAQTLRDLSQNIPESIDWVIRVDGHTDDTPLSGFGAFADNWELSQARALSVVRYMTGALGFPPGRLAANGFGEFHPIMAGDTDAARAANRRIELKLTER